MFDDCRENQVLVVNGQVRVEEKLGGDERVGSDHYYYNTPIPTECLGRQESCDWLDRTPLVNLPTGPVHNCTLSETGDYQPAKLTITDYTQLQTGI